jgi:hypothetical protein
MASMVLVYIHTGLAGEVLHVFIDILLISLVDFSMSLDEVVKEVWLGPDSVSNEKYDIVAGFECGACQFAACSVLYCRKLGCNGEENEPWGWRMAVWEHYDFQVCFFDDVPSFLNGKVSGPGNSLGKGIKY